MAIAGGCDFVTRLGAVLILARILAPEDFGLVGMVMAITGIAEIFKDLGLGIATVQRKDISHQQISSLFWVNVLFGGLLVIAFSVMSPVISWFYGDSRLILIALPLATTLLWGGMAVQHEALLSRQFKQGPLALVRLIATVLSFSLGITLALNGFGYWALVVREVTRSLIHCLGVWLSCRWMPDLRISLKEVRGFLNFGRDLTVTNIALAIIGKIDSVLIGKLFGADALGVYRQASTLVSTPVEQFNGPVFSVMQPGLSALQSDPERYRSYYRRVVGFVAMVTMPLGVFVATYPEELTLLLLGTKWIHAAPFVGIFAVAVMLRPTMTTTGIVLITLGKSRVLLGLAVVHGLVLTLMILVGLPWGALGIAMAHVATSFITAPLILRYCVKHSPVNIRSFFSAIFKPLLSALFMGVSLIIFRFMVPIANPLPDILAGCTVGAIAYLLPWVLLPSGRSELRLILQDVQNAVLRKPIPTEPTVEDKRQESHAAT